MSKPKPGIKQKLIEIPEETYERIVQLAKSEFRSVNGEINELLHYAILTKMVFVKKKTDKELALYQSVMQNNTNTKNTSKGIEFDEDVMTEQEMEEFLRNINIG